MTLSARRLLALAALAGLGGWASAQAVAATAGEKARTGRPADEGRGHATAKQAATKRTRAKPKAKAKARAVKLTGDLAWAPASALAPTRAPLTGGASGAAGSGATGAAGNGAGTGSGGGAGGTGNGGGTGTTTPTTPELPPQQQALGVTVDERVSYTMVLSRTTLTAGSVVVQLNNIGEDPHNLRIVRTSPGGGAATDFPDTDKQAQTTRSLTLPAGTYYLYCTLQQPQSHEAAGMHATLRVEP